MTSLPMCLVGTGTCSEILLNSQHERVSSRVQIYHAVKVYLKSQVMKTRQQKRSSRKLALA